MLNLVLFRNELLRTSYFMRGSTVRMFSSRSFQLSSERQETLFEKSHESSQETVEASENPTIKPINVRAIETPSHVNLINGKHVKDSNLAHHIKQAFMKLVGQTFTPVQEATIDEFLTAERGLVVRAKTGTGKTLAFGLPLLHKLKHRKHPNVPHVETVIFAPTRDLAIQTSDAIHNLMRNCSLPINNKNIEKIVGGQDMRQQIKKCTQFQKPPIVAATPGRFLDLITNSKNFQSAFTRVENVIIDEADELLSMSFKEDLERIMDKLKELNTSDMDPKFKVLLFSATIDKNVLSLAENIMGKDYKFIDTNVGSESEVNQSVEQTLVVSDSIFHSYAALVDYVYQHKDDPKFKPMIFLPNTYSVDFVFNLLNKIIPKPPMNARDKRDYVCRLHGKLTQGRRNMAQLTFKIRKRAILVCSNVASRGLDFPDVTHVLQIGVNHDVSNYTHRVGRTGRAGKIGKSILFTTDFEQPFVEKLKENGNKFHEVIKSEPNEDIERKIRNTVKNEDFDQIATSNLGIYNQLPEKFGKISKKDYVKHCALLYRDMKYGPGGAFEDVEESAQEKPFLSSRAASGLGINTDYSRRYYDIPGSATSRGSSGYRNKSGAGNRGGYRNNDRGGYRKNDRGGFGGENKGGSSRDRGNYKSSGKNSRTWEERGGSSNKNSNNFRNDRYSKY
ncbi:hypothetical protein LJB42_001043 [Komagataella kurtzmanii]|nr:hypothetical protein LJB42_001043 [Komagataella kurtzmanii]